MNRHKDQNGRCKAAVLLVGLAAPISAVQAGVTNYTYDELGRLVRVSDTRNGDRVYAYDPAGNRTQVVVGSPRVGEVLETAPADPSEKIYSASNEPPSDEGSLPVAMSLEPEASAPVDDPILSEPEPRPAKIR